MSISLKTIATTLAIFGSIFSAGSVLAEKDDRFKPINVSFDRRGETNIAQRRSEIVGHVVLTQGSVLLRADRASIQETPEGFVQAIAIGTSSQQVYFQQNLDDASGVIEASADELEYNTQKDTVRLMGNARIRQLRGAQVVSDATGNSMTYDRRIGSFWVEGGGSKNSSSRARILIMPRPAIELKSDASAPSEFELRPALTLQQPK